jgi:cell filamentation protein
VPHYTHPGTDTLKNKLGATTHDELERYEEPLVAMRDTEIMAGHLPTRQFDGAHLRAIHRHLFQDVFEWAGRTRDEEVPLSDGTIATDPFMRKADGSAFMLGPLIPAALDDIATRLKSSGYLCGLSRADFADQAADITADINAVHAFREGNGRAQRSFMRELATQAGHILDFTVISRERMIAASIAANEHQDKTVMRRLFHDASDPARIAALRDAIESLAEHGFPWNDRYIATAEPGHSIEAVFVGSASDHFMARTNEQILIGNTADLPDPHPARGERFFLNARQRPGGETGNEPPGDHTPGGPQRGIRRGQRR